MAARDVVRTLARGLLLTAAVSACSSGSSSSAPGAGGHGAGAGGSAAGASGASGSGGSGAGAAGTGAAGDTATAGSSGSGAAGASGAGGGAGAAGSGAGAGGAKGTVACGTAQADLSAVSGTEGIAIDADGTVYFSQSSAVGRLTPGAAGKLDKEWVKLPAASTVWGLAIDHAAKALYAGSPSTQTIYKITLEDVPTVTPLVKTAGQPNGLTMGPDGALYYSDFRVMGNIYRVTSDGARTMVTTTPINQPDGVAFGPDGALYVDEFQDGGVLKLTLTAGVETARADFVAKGMVSAADGLAFDADGNAYVGFAGGVSRVSPDGKTLTNLAKGGTANVEFGAGALDCKDIYAVTGMKIVRVPNTIAGAPVPWHISP
jgi:sugar lactone lactonase YvrE